MTTASQTAPSLDAQDLRYLTLLAVQYPTIRAASVEIISLNALLQLPKGTEHFVSDIHGEYEAFLHVLRNASGSISRKIEETFAASTTESERRQLATLVYYPRRKLPLILKQLQDGRDEWLRQTLFRLITLCRVASRKYTRAAVRSAMPPDLADLLEELIQEQESTGERQEYYDNIVQSILDAGRARDFVVAFCELIQRLSVAHLHVIGDVYDRGPGAHIIMDTLLDYHSLDVQWGNHDIVWMGAAAGSAACMANVLRVSLRYANLETVEDGYGISLLPLAAFAMEAYAQDPCRQFAPKVDPSQEFTRNELRLMAQMQKAIAIIQFKLEGQLIKRRPQYQMADRLLLDKIDFERGAVCLDGREYPLNDTHFPTVDPADPYALSPAESIVVEKLLMAFANSEKLQRHVRLLYARGGMYLVHNNNLLYHGCIIMNRDGSFKEVGVAGAPCHGREFMDRAERLVRQGYFATDAAQKQAGQDMMWYLWSGADSPLYGKDKMATFERTFVDDPLTHRETMDPYYDLRDREETARNILREFGLDPDTAHIVNGHVPVRVRRGESPVKAGGKLIVIDGGFAKAYHERTGIAGYTLIHNSYGFLLASHLSFESTQTAIEEGVDSHSRTEILEQTVTRMRVKDTDRGRQLRRRIVELQQLVQAYRDGLIKENSQSD
jgi:fructose-1,6-bisphosphatase-3